jgi:DNA-directed RNA polymerase specialized sigma24 family protein
MALLRAVAGRFRTTERDELEAELARRLLALKRTRPTGIRSWDRYLAKFLFNKASNWIRDQRLREQRSVGLDSKLAADDQSEQTRTLLDALASSEADIDLRLVVSDVLKELDPELRRLWELLLRENGNQLRVARILGKHRNTIRLWVQKIRQVLIRHGFPGSP